MNRGCAGSSKRVTHLFVVRFQFIQQVEQGPEADIALACSAQIVHNQRQVFQVTVFAVAVIQAREDAQHLEMALHAHPLIVAVETGKIVSYRQPGLARLFPVADQPVERFRFFPADIGILEQRRQVVGDRAIYRILKIEDAGIRFGCHQVARMIVAMHIYARLRQIAGEDATEAFFQRAPLAIAKRHAEMFGDVPLRKQVEFAAQQRFVVRRQFFFIRGELDFDQGVGGRTVKFTRRITVQRLQVGGTAQVGQQQKTLPQVLRIHVRHMRPRRFEQLGDMQKRAAVLVLRRSVHHDERPPIRESGAKIAAEAGIGGGRGKGKGLAGKLAVQPCAKELLALHIGLSDVNGKLAEVYHLTIVMRFRFKPVAFSLLCTFAHHASANAELFALRMDKTFMVITDPAHESPAFVEADYLAGQKENMIEATGNAILRKRWQSIRADRLLYSQDTQDLEAHGSVVLEQDGNTMSGPHLKLNLDTSIGTMTQPEFYLIENGGRGAANMLHIHDKQHYTLDNASYTTCPAEDEDWLLKMRGLEIDRDRQIGTAYHAWIEFMGVPILYSPWMNFPLNDQRKSGLLSPVFGSTTQGGRELTLPYYWNIAPNRDATIAPRIMTKRGILLNNEFRYLEPRYGGELQVDVLPNDKLAMRSRTRVHLTHNHALAGGLSGFANLHSVSDDAYFRDLGNTVNATSQANLLQEAVLTYGAGWWNAAARVQRYQTLQDPAAPISVPYKRMPQLLVNAQRNFAGANLAFAGEFVDFSHSTAPNARRLVINPSVSYPLVNDPAFYVTPKIALHHTHYALGANNASGSSNVSRTLPLLSLDSGVAFERDWDLFGGSYVHTLEPRAFYVYVPYKNQDALPNFDSAQAGFDFTQMFTENRFFGSDRVGDSNHITLAMTSRLLDQENGMERLKLLVGERFSLETPKVNLVAPTMTTNKSDILLAASGSVTKAWSFDSEFQYDPNQSHSQRYNIAARYRPELGKSLDLGYRFARSTLRQVDLSGQWPLSGHWRAVGRLNYSLQDGKTLESIAGLEYNQSCWTFRFVAQRFTVAAQQVNTGIFLQLELNDLISVGVDPINALKQNVPSYTKLNEKPASKPSSVLR